MIRQPEENTLNQFSASPSWNTSFFLALARLKFLDFEFYVGILNFGKITTLTTISPAK